MSLPNPPATSTLARYGLTLREWYDFAGEQCSICERPWSDDVKPVVDHEHVRGWKAMLPSGRRLYIRGIICRGCNYFILTRHGTALKHLNAYLYLKRYALRRGNGD